MFQHFAKSTAVVAALTLGATGALAETFTVGTSAQGSSGYAMASAMAKVTLSEADIRLRAMPQGGPVVTLPLVNNGELDFSIAVSFVAAFANQGSAMFNDLGSQENVRVVAALRTLPLGVMVTRDSDIHSLADFKGKTMPSEFNSQKIMNSLLNATYEMGGISADDVSGLPTPTGERSLQDLIGGKVAGTIYTMDAGITQQANAQIGIRYISLDPSDKNRAILSSHVPGAIIDVINPGDAYPGVEEPVNAIVAPFLLMTNADTDGESIKAILAALAGNKDELVASFAGFGSFSADGMYKDVGIPYHPAALEFYKEQGVIE